MQIGTLKERIELQQLVEVNDSGSLSDSWETAATVWGNVKSQRGSEAFEAARLNAREIIRVQIRFRFDVTVKWRMLWMDQAYNITAVDRSSRDKGELWLTGEIIGAL